MRVCLQDQLTVAKALLATVAVIGACSGCSHVAHLDAGQVLSKEHHDGYYSTYQSCTYITSGKTMIPICTPITTYVPPSWVLHLKNDRHEGVADVDEQTYEQCHEGDWYGHR